ncbi:MarR family transcriptional regulator [Streptomyces antarcticus]|uniref:MarR family transcriptional regulator n=1 Tax=Streptomyces antarcticus TaxID=2996458 RepID=UPI00226E0F55|nr:MULTISPECIES: helix-turn-helix domain-containing protein [unclassified Streptomyces]MCY0940109.1 helix-turn-helix domain-containing protein [Streptomyces sp. H34-AA3]MCZ4080757.1 helix-turn-helix domain-containing protein [Streptomyces sp. H34-S5]
MCAAGLFAEDLLQDGYRRDRAVLAHVAAHPGATPRQTARSLGAAEKVVARSLSRLTDDGLLERCEEGPASEPRSYRLAG